MSKSHVSIEEKICPVCGVKFETNSILLDTTLNESLESTTVSGYALCDKHQREFEEGYLHLVVAEGEGTGDLLKIEDAQYTGEILSIKRDVLSQIIDREIDPRIPFVYIEPEAANIIKSLAGISNEEPAEQPEE